MASGITTSPSPDLTQITPELDSHSSFTWEKFLRQGLDAHFDGRGETVADGPISVLSSTYWTRNPTLTTGQMVCPVDQLVIANYTKDTFNVGYFKTTLPILTVDTQAIWLGFENGGGFGAGITAFKLYRLPAGATVFRAQTGASEVTITTALPADYQAVAHVYMVIVLRDWTEFYIDATLVAVALNSPNLVNPAVNYPPYGVFGGTAYTANPARPYATRLNGLIEVVGMYTELTLPISPYYARFADTDNHPGRVFRLYQNGLATLFAGSVIAAGSLTSHPVPILGYASKTVLFQATGDGSLVVQLLLQDGQWRTLATIATVAATLTAYSIAVEGVLARVVFTPGAFPCTVSSAEVSLTP